MRGFPMHPRPLGKGTPHSLPLPKSILPRFLHLIVPIPNAQAIQGDPEKSSALTMAQSTATNRLAYVNPREGAEPLTNWTDAQSRAASPASRKMSTRQSRILPWQLKADRAYVHFRWGSLLAITAGGARPSTKVPVWVCIGRRSRSRRRTTIACMPEVIPPWNCVFTELASYGSIVSTCLTRANQLRSCITLPECPKGP